MRYLSQRGMSIALALAVVLVGITAAPVTAQEQTDPGECDYASGDDGQHTGEQDNAEPEGEADCHGGGGGEHGEQPPREIVGSEE